MATKSALATRKAVALGRITGAIEHLAPQTPDFVMPRQPARYAPALRQVMLLEAIADYAEGAIPPAKAPTKKKQPKGE